MAAMRRAHILNYLIPQFGNIKLSDLNPVKIENWLVSLPLANQTKNHILYTFSIILKEANREGLIKRNPLSMVEPMGKEYQSRDILTLEELDILFPENFLQFQDRWPNYKYGAMFCLMSSSGMRLGEVRALQWHSVLWDIPGLLIVQAVKADGSIGPTKGKEKRGVLLPARTVKILKNWYAQAIYGTPQDFIFCNRGGEFLSRETIRDYFKNGLETSGINFGNRNIVLHSA